MFKSFKIRIYPNKEQEKLIYDHINAQRFIWNYLLDLQNQEYEKNKKYLSKYDMTSIITKLRKKKEFSWLQKVSLGSLRNVCFQLDESFKIFFKNKKKEYRPKFKTKKEKKQLYSIRKDIGKFYFKTSKQCHIECIGDVKYKTDYDVILGNKEKYFNPIVKIENNKFFIYFSKEYENQVQKLTNNKMGIDLGIKRLAVVSFNGKAYLIPNINKTEKMYALERKKKKVQRNLSRKYKKNKTTFKNSNRYKKELQKYYKILQKISNIKNNYIHQMTHFLVTLKPCRVVMENLEVTKLAKKDEGMYNLIRKQCFYTFKKYMRYKCEWNGIEFVEANQFFPSSKKCCYCGNIKGTLSLNQRIFKCSFCGNEIDRDINAAINLENY